MASAAHTTPSDSSPKESQSLNLGKLFEDNIVPIIGFIIFLTRLEYSVKEIKKDIDNQNKLLSLELQSLRLNIAEVKTEIHETSANAKAEIQLVTNKLNSTNRILFSLVDFINSDRNEDGKTLFVVSKFDKYD
ncbi:hypothetical protein V0288_11265 [Pannus brasiliensis CCIBt3594]|uniref:Uncharacterized protein n=1 Tax=Pannus brasiliensis CCIBt3594 TaxID=1427578 RepID=A0AAW9QXX6_9CHRO